MQHADVIPIPDYGHLVHEEDPDGLAGLIRNYLP